MLTSINFCFLLVDYNISMSKNNTQSVDFKKKVARPAESQLKLRTQLDQTKKCINNQKDASFQKENSKSQEESCCFPIQFLSDFFQIYKFGDGKDKVVMAFGIILALISGVSFPLFMYFWGKEMDHVIFDFYNLQNTMNESLKYYGAFIGLGVGSFIIDGIVFSLWKLLSQTISQKFRAKYLESYIKRNVKWLEQQNLYELSSKFKLNCLMIERATGDKVALFYNLNGIVVAGIIAAVCVRWTFTLFLLAIIPIGFAALGYFIYVLIMKKIETKEFYSKAESQSTEAVALIKTVKMLGAEKYQEGIYNECLKEFEKKMSPYPLKLGISTALFYFIQYFLIGVGFMYGIQCVKGTSACPVSITGSRYTVGDIHIVFFEIFICAYFFLQLASNFDAIRDAIHCSKEIFTFMRDTEAQCQQQERMHSDADLPQSIGQIEFRNVVFAYPSNPSKKILKKISLKPLKNKFNAFVGVTGSGKSTVTQLILKFYNDFEGQIFIGNKQIRSIDGNWMRSKIGYVGQEPILFSGTLRENILVGKENATDEEIWEVLRLTNMYQFAMRVPEKLDYNVGFGGSRLSGGQKQRIAIARALIKKPELLVLDQATSALDRKTQKIIQHTLESIFLNRDLKMTVICIAHKIKTIRKADRIWYLENGTVKEEGRFEQLSCFKDVQLPPEEQVQSALQLEEQLPPLASNEGNKDKEEQVKEDAEQYKGSIYSKLLSYSENKCLYVVGIFAAFLNGLSHPGSILILAYTYAQQVKLLAYGIPYNWCGDGSPSDCNQVLDGHHLDAVKFQAGLIGFAFYAFVPYLVQFYVMSKIEDQITSKLRKEVFSKLMLMPVNWYEKPENEGGRVASRFGLDVKEVSTLVTAYVPVLITNFTTIIGGIVLCLAYLWQVGLLSLVTVPLIALGGYISVIFIGGYDDQDLHKYEESDKIADELMTNIKVAFSLNYQNKLLEKYKSLLFTSPVKSLIQGLKIGCFFGLSIFVIEMSIGTSMYAADHILPQLSNVKFDDYLVALVVPLWSGWIAGNSFFFIAKSASGKQSAKAIFQLLEDKTESEYQSRNSPRIIKPLPNEVKGRFELKNVSFKRGNEAHSKYVLRHVSLVIEAGQKAAIVGESGCGKSTLLLLIQRFYDYQGQITLDGVNILEYDLQQYRQYFAILNQEPSLFTGSVRSNLVFNSQANEETVHEACKMSFCYDANQAWKGDVSIKDCINQFLERDVGPKGTKLSGGEKQRVACARAILKKPRIFIMDEGTSALDRQTEKRVQENIDNKMKGITMISIAHRMETIENSDVIFMLEDGKVVESGKYNEMMERKAHFQKFVEGNKYRTIDQIAEKMLHKLIMKLLGIKQ